MISLIEIDHFAEEDMFCMFCGAQVLYQESEPIPCPHVFFIATSEAGYEYVSEDVEAIMPKEFPDEDEGDDEDDKSLLERIQEVNGVPGESFIVMSGSMAPAMLEVYVGFFSGNT
jgi:hypothetical protein